MGRMFDYNESDALVVELAASTVEEAADGEVGGSPGSTMKVPPEDSESPVTEADLTSWEIYEELVEYGAAVRMNLPVAKVDAKLDRQVLVRDVMRYATVRRGDESHDYGVAIRLVVTVAAAKIDGELTLPVIAAKAELGMLSASARLRVIGYRNNDIGGMLPDFARLDVGNYGKYTEASDNIRAFIAKNKSFIFPVLLRTVEKPSSNEADLLQAVSRARALRAVANREPLDDVVRNSRDAWPEFASAVTEAYKNLAPGISDTDRPTKAQADAARRWATWA